VGSSNTKDFLVGEIGAGGYFVQIGVTRYATTLYELTSNVYRTDWTALSGVPKTNALKDRLATFRVYTYDD
jgi:hypothetical protein